MSIPPTIQSPLGTPIPSPIKRATQTMTPTKLTGLLPSDIQVDTFTSPVRTSTSFPNSSAPKDTPAKKRKQNAPQRAPKDAEQEEAKKQKAELAEAEKMQHRKNLEKSWTSIIDRLIDDPEDKKTIQKALEESKAAVIGLHDQKISRKYPSEESLEHTIKLMLFLKSSQGIHLDTWRSKDEEHHFLVRCLQDGTAGHCLTAFQEFFGVNPTSSTTLVIDTNNNILNLLKEIPPNGPISEARYLAIPLAESNISAKKFIITPATLIALKKTTLENRLTNPKVRPRYMPVVNRNTKEPITRYDDLN